MTYIQATVPKTETEQRGIPKTLSRMFKKGGRESRVHVTKEHQEHQGSEREHPTTGKARTGTTATSKEPGVSCCPSSCRSFFALP